MKGENKTPLSDTLGTALAFLDIVGDAIASNIRAAGDTVGNEVSIKKKQAERGKLIFRLGETAYKKGKIDAEIVERIESLDKDIERLIANRASADDD